MLTKPVVSAAKFSAYRKAHRLYCDLLRKDVATTEMVQAAEESARKIAKPIFDAIKAAQGTSYARIMFANSLILQVQELEERLGIPKKSMNGMRVRMINLGSFRYARKSCKYPAMATAAILTNRHGSWQIDEIKRIDSRGIARATTVLYLPDAARDKIVDNFLSQI